MLFVPGDHPVTGPVNYGCMVAMLLAEEWKDEQADIQALIAEAQELLTAVDLAISGKDFTHDATGRQMQTSWAFIGPGLLRSIEVIKLTASKKPYEQLAVIVMALTLRRQTLEANDIQVLKGA